MRFKLTIIAILFCQENFSQNLRDTVYFKKFEIFIHSTETLIKESHHFSHSTTSGRQKKPKSDSVSFYAKEVKNNLRKLDSIDRFSLSMANYFVKGKWARSQDLSSPVAQLQCSYSHYIQNLRKAGDNISEIVNAALVLETHLQKGFPPSIYCPYIYDPVEVDFEKLPVMKIISRDSIRKEN